MCTVSDITITEPDKTENAAAVDPSSSPSSFKTGNQLLKNAVMTDPKAGVYREKPTGVTLMKKIAAAGSVARGNKYYYYLTLIKQLRTRKILPFLLRRSVYEAMAGSHLAVAKKKKKKNKIKKGGREERKS